MKNTETISVSLEKKTVQQLNKINEETKIPRSQLIKTAVANYLSEHYTHISSAEGNDKN